MKGKYKILFSFFFFIGLLIFGVAKCYDYKNIASPFYEKKLKYHEICNGNLSDLEEWDKYYCETEYPYDLGFPLMMDYVITELDQVMIPLIVILLGLSIYHVNKIFKSKVVKNILVRQNYKSFLFKIFKEAYSFIWITPVVMLIIFLIGIYLFGYDVTYSISGNGLWRDSLKIPWLFIVIYLLNITMYLSTFINIGLVVSRKCQNFITSLITSSLIIIIIQLFLEIVIRKMSIWNLMNFFRFDDADGIIGLFMASMVWFISSWIILNYSYKNKEKMVLECEN